MNATLLAALATACCLGTAAAQREIQVRALSTVANHPEGRKAFIHDPGSRSPATPIEVQTYLNRETQRLKVKGRALVFTTDPARSSIDDAAQLLGKVEVPPTLTTAIFLFVPAGATGAPHVELIDASRKAFPAGSFNVLNLTAEGFRFELEGKNFDCPPGVLTLIADPPVGPNNASGMRAFRKVGNEWKYVAASVWPHPGKKRVIQLVTVEPGSERIDLKGFRDVVGPE